MTVLSRGGDAPGRPQRSFPRGRAHHPTRPRVAWTGLGRGRGRCAAGPPGSALHLPPPPGARERCGSPPSALCYSPTSCLWSPTPAYFPGREAAEGREFLGDTPTGSSLLPPPSPAPGCSPGKREPRAGVAARRQGCRRTLEGAARLLRLLSLWRRMETLGTKVSSPGVLNQLCLCPTELCSGSVPLSAGSNWRCFPPNIVLVFRKQSLFIC